MNCHPTLCGMLVDVEDGRLVVAGDPDNPDSRGFLCIRGQASREIIDNPPRLLHPLIRARRGSGDWRRGDVGGSARADRRSHARGRAGRGRASGRGTALRQQLRHARGLASAPPLRQSLRLPVVEPHDDLLGARRLRPRPHRRAGDEHQGRHGGPRPAHRPVGRQPRLAAQHRAPSDRGAPARRPRHHDRRARDGGGGPVGRDAAGATGQRRRAGAGDDARDRRRGPRRPRVRRRAHRGLRRAGRARARALARVGRRGHRDPGRADRRARATLRDDPAGDDRAGRQHPCTRAPAAGRERAPSAACPRSPATSGFPAAASARATAAPRTARASTDIAPTSDGRPAVHPQPDVAHHRGDARRPAARAAAARHRHAVVVSPRPAASRRAWRGGPRRLLRSVPQRHRAALRRRGAAGHRVARGARLQEHQHAPLPDAERPGAAGRDALERVGAARAGARASVSPTSIPGRATAVRSTRSSIIRPPATPPWRRCAPRAGCAR